MIHDSVLLPAKLYIPTVCCKQSKGFKNTFPMPS